MQRDEVLTARAVEALIANGHIIVIFEDFILKLDSWLEKHPGGRLAILHMVGRDATDEIKASHKEKQWKTMKAFRIGRKIPGIWVQRTPPIRGGIFRKEEDQVSTTPKDALDLLDVPASPDSYESNSLSDSVSNLSEASLPTSLSSADSVVGDVLRKTDTRTSVQDDLDATARSKPHTAKAFTGSSSAYTAQAEQDDIARDNLAYPSVDPAIQHSIALKYKALAQRVQDEGYYTCRYVEYAKEASRYALFFGLSMFALRNEWYMTSAIFLGLFWHQVMFTAHDAGHRAITGNFAVDSLIGILIGDFCCGLSIGWWKRSHNVHHLVTNHPEHDPDIQNVPLFATTPSFFRGVHSTYYDFSFAWDKAAEILVPYQKYTYYPIMGVARFNLYLLSWLHVLSSKSGALVTSSAWWIQPTEIVAMSCYWYIFGYLLLWKTLPTWGVRIAFVLLSHVITMPLHVQITLSHWGMSTSDLGESESFAQRQLRTTMDVDCPAWLDWIHGGLQFQAVHHLFPRVPRHNLRRLQTLVKEFCEDTKIPYTLLGFVDGNSHVLSRLDEVGQQVKHLVNCQRYMAEHGVRDL
ncbi:fatty acid desaturase-domain-containing protein [Lasiosphaeria miniovina]|uniref:Delta 8-(E)-sphingolipid desaturase n=1 Tax=Lasiosphaeria miniovina TaxID=1954250 RepID=A0AA40DRT5_9PEZI|nr:fatty acid desaturase-domain-containing protein [Lasiosphaeria miniovina]KAK0713195.1 fatty acid desaturase-domain-containing protein [Lasiosphaeria miniovina]